MDVGGHDVGGGLGAGPVLDEIAGRLVAGGVYLGVDDLSGGRGHC